MCYCALTRIYFNVGTDMTLYSLFTEGELELLNALRSGLLSSDTVPSEESGESDEPE